MSHELIMENVIRDKVAASKRTSYPTYEPEGDGPITPEDALRAIDRIRNSIVGLQTINWSEHIYPLVAILNRAGIKGLPYPENRANYGSCLDSRNEAIAWLKNSPCMRGTSEWRVAVEVFFKRIGEELPGDEQPQHVKMVPVSEVVALMGGYERDLDGVESGAARKAVADARAWIEENLS